MVRQHSLQGSLGKWNVDLFQTTGLELGKGEEASGCNKQQMLRLVFASGPERISWPHFLGSSLSVQPDLSCWPFRELHPWTSCQELWCSAPVARFVLWNLVISLNFPPVSCDSCLLVSWSVYNFSAPLALCSSSVAQSCLTLCDPWTVARWAPLSVGFSRQESWSGLPSPHPGTEPVSPASPTLAGGFFTTESPGKPALCLPC